MGQKVYSTEGADSINVDSTGNVGIGTASPGAKLDVSGSIKANTTVLATQAPSLPLTVGAVGSSTYYQFNLPAVNTWYNVFATDFNTTNGTVMIYGRIGLADRTVQQSFLAFTGRGAVNTSGDFINIVQGSATNLRVNAGFLQMQSSYDTYGLSVYLYIVRIS